MATKSQILNLAKRIEALATGRTTHLVVLDPGETEEQARRRNALPDSARCVYVCTGVPRSHGEGCA